MEEFAACASTEKLKMDEVLAGYMQLGFELPEIQRALDTCNNDLSLLQESLFGVRCLI